MMEKDIWDDLFLLYWDNNREKKMEKEEEYEGELGVGRIQ